MQTPDPKHTFYDAFLPSTEVYNRTFLLFVLLLYHMGLGPTSNKAPNTNAREMRCRLCHFLLLLMVDARVDAKIYVLWLHCSTMEKLLFLCFPSILLIYFRFWPLDPNIIWSKNEHCTGMNESICLRALHFRSRSPSFARPTHGSPGVLNGSKRRPKRGPSDDRVTL